MECKKCSKNLRHGEKVRVKVGDIWSGATNVEELIKLGVYPKVGLKIKDLLDMLMYENWSAGGCDHDYIDIQQGRINMLEELLEKYFNVIIL